MSWGADEAAACKALVDLALAEDLGDRGDITSAAVIPVDMRGRAVFVGRAAGVVAGLPAAQAVFVAVDPAVQFTALVADWGGGWRATGARWRARAYDSAKYPDIQR